jgi:hypothetical protein
MMWYTPMVRSKELARREMYAEAKRKAEEERERKKELEKEDALQYFANLVQVGCLIDSTASRLAFARPSLPHVVTLPPLRSHVPLVIPPGRCFARHLSVVPRID